MLRLNNPRSKTSSDGLSTTSSAAKSPLLRQRFSLPLVLARSLLIGELSFMISPTTTPLAQQLKSRLLAHEAKIGIIGLGYVGLPLALLYSGASFPVTGFDIDDSKV